MCLHMLTLGVEVANIEPPGDGVWLPKQLGEVRSESCNLGSMGNMSLPVGHNDLDSVSAQAL